MLRSYSRAVETVSRGPRAIGGEHAAEVLEAAVNGRARAGAAACEVADRAVRDRRAQREVARFERAEGPGQIDPTIRRLDRAGAAAVPCGGTVIRGEPVGQRRSVAAWHVEGQRVAATGLALPSEARAWSSASRRISFSMVLRPSMRSKARTLSSSLRTSEAATTGSFDPTAMAPPSSISRRHRNRRFGATPFRLATAETDSPGMRLSSMMRSFS